MDRLLHSITGQKSRCSVFVKHSPKREFTLMSTFVLRKDYVLYLFKSAVQKLISFTYFHIYTRVLEAPDPFSASVLSVTFPSWFNRVLLLYKLSWTVHKVGQTVNVFNLHKPSTRKTCAVIESLSFRYTYHKPSPGISTQNAAKTQLYCLYYGFSCPDRQAYPSELGGRSPEYMCPTLWFANHVPDEETDASQGQDFFIKIIKKNNHCAPRNALETAGT